jgi:hypothetical protein
LVLGLVGMRLGFGWMVGVQLIEDHGRARIHVDKLQKRGYSKRDSTWIAHTRNEAR